MIMAASVAAGQSARQALGAAPVVPLTNESPAKIVIDPPLAESLSQGRVVIQYRTENLHIVPVFGPAALAVSPRVGHIHVTVDDNPWRWADASGLPLIINGLPPGPHKILIQLENANHQPLDEGVVRFTIPAGLTETGASLADGESVMYKTFKCLAAAALRPYSPEMRPSGAQAISVVRPILSPSPRTRSRRRLPRRSMASQSLPDTGSGSWPPHLTRQAASTNYGPFSETL
jgi:hypothetical protein